MLRKVFRTGNSIVVSLPREAVEFLGLTEGSDVVVELDREHRQVVVAPVHHQASEIDADFARQVNAFIERYRLVLETLAK